MSQPTLNLDGREVCADCGRVVAAIAKRREAV